MACNFEANFALALISEMKWVARL